MRTQSVILNLIPSGVNPVVHLSQYDQEDDGALLFNIYDGNVLADLTDCTATIEGTKPDGTFYMYPCTVYNTYLTSAVNFQMTSIAGNYPAEVRINRGGENVGTINLTMMIEPAGVGRVDVSDTEIPSLLDDIETSVDEAEYWAHVAEHAVTGVASWNGRTGAVVPVAGDYNAAQVDYNNSNSGLNATKTQGAIDELTPKKIITSNDAFNSTKTYTAGEWLIHQGVLYEVITACTGITPPNATYYNPITLHELKNRIDALNSNLSEIISLSTNDIINSTDRSSVVSNVSALMTYNPHLKIGIVQIRFTVTSSVGTSPAYLGNWASPSVTPQGFRPTVPLVRDSDSNIDGVLYANNVLGTNTKIAVYSISTPNVSYIAQFPVILN